MAYTAWSVVFGEQPSATKWNLLGSNDAHFYSFLGADLTWQSWVPTWTNVSGGTTNYAKYTTIGNTIHFRTKYTLAGAGVSGSIIHSLPANTHADYDVASVTPIHGVAIFRDDSTSTTKTGSILWASASTVTLRPHKADVTYTETIIASSTVPFTFAVSDTIYSAGSYEKA